jgi:hypothetical protein
MEGGGDDGDGTSGIDGGSDGSDKDGSGGNGNDRDGSSNDGKCGSSDIDDGSGNGSGSGRDGVGTDGKDSGGTNGKDGRSGNDTRRELWRIISGSEVRFMWNITSLPLYHYAPLDVSTCLSGQCCSQTQTIIIPAYTQVSAMQITMNSKLCTMRII